MSGCNPHFHPGANADADQDLALQSYGWDPSPGDVIDESMLLLSDNMISISPLGDDIILKLSQIYGILINIRSIRNDIKRLELQYRLDIDKPHYIALTEIWLDDSFPDLLLAGYTCISKRHRRRQFH